MGRADLLSKSWGRKLLFASLYVSEGAPIGYIWWALPTKLKDAGTPVEQVTQLTAMLTLPWAFKFMWAPLVDAVRTARWGLRAWLVAAQLCMGVALLPIIATAPMTPAAVPLLTVLLLLHAFTAATQDVSVDALAVASVPEDERGTVNGWMQLGMLLGRAVFGGVALYVEQWVGERVVLIALLGCVWLSMALVLGFTREPARPPAEGGFLAALWAALSSKATWFGLAFAALAGCGFKAVGALAGPMLLDQGLSKEDAGLFFSVTAALLAGGALAGGKLADRAGRGPAVRLSLLAVAAGIAILVVCLWLSTGVTVIVIALGALYFVAGAFAAAEFAMYMDATDPRLGATQFSAFMGAINLCEAWSAYSAGRAVARWDYAIALGLLAALSLLSLPLVSRIVAPSVTRQPS